MMSIRSPNSLTALPFALAFAATGCEAPQAPEIASGAPIEDSAGIVIVNNPRPAPGSRLGWQVGPEPIVSIGTVEATDDFQLHRVDDALKLADGRIVVANGGSHQLLVFDGDGNHLTSWGQSGEGPGDFGGAFGGDGLGPPRLFWMEPWPGDSLAICHGTYSGGKHLLAFWDGEGNHGRTVNLARNDGIPICRDVLQNGVILASRPSSPLFAPPDPSDAGDLIRTDHEFSLVSADGSSSVSLGLQAGNETFWHLSGDTPFVLMDPPFTKTLVWTAWGDLVIVSPTDHYELRAYTNDGSLVRIVRREHDVRSPTEADLDDYRAARTNPHEALEAVPLPESFPAFTAIEVDLLGNLWVREYNLPEDEDRALWTVFDPEGVALGFVETPSELLIYEIGEDYILGEVRDDLGVEYIQLWGLNRDG